MNIPLHIVDKAVVAGEDPQKYVEKIFRFLDDMKPDTSIAIQKVVKSANEDLFKDVVKLYMKNRPWQGDITFSEDMSSIKKTQYK